MNEIALEDAYTKWADELVGYAAALVGATGADDVVADAFAGLLRRERDDVAAGKTSRWASLIDPRPYLFRTVLNTATMTRRSSSRRAARDDRAARRTAATAWGPSSDAYLADPAVRSAVDALSTQQRGAVYLTYWLDLDSADVAASLGCSTGSVKRHLARARTHLRTALDHKDAP